MSEGEIIEAVNSIYDRYWVMYQWWLSISIGVLILAHLVATRLNLPLLLSTMALYSMYTLWVAILLEHNIEIYAGYINDLNNFDGPIRKGSEFLAGLKGSSLGFLGARLGKLAAIVMFFSTNAYLGYCYMNAKITSGH